MKIDKIKLSKSLKEFREKNEYTLRDISILADMDISAVSRFERQQTNSGRLLALYIKLGYELPKDVITFENLDIKFKKFLEGGCL